MGANLGARDGIGVSIPTRLERRVQFANTMVMAGSQVFQSPPASKGGCNGRASRGEGRERACFNPHPPRKAGAMPFEVMVMPRRKGFNPHPPRKAGAIGYLWYHGIVSEGFNPHPPRKAGAMATPFRIEPAQARFNPHPPRKAGAIVPPAVHRLSPIRFNPHPPRKAGAMTIYLLPGRSKVVSIPTRLERRVQ